MGTNYFLCRNVCKSCGHAKESVHIGKFSMGWKFAFYSGVNGGHSSFDDWKKAILAKGTEIYGDSGTRINKSNFFQIVKEAASGKQIDEHSDDMVDAHETCDGKHRFISVEFS